MDGIENNTDARASETGAEQTDTAIDDIVDTSGGYVTRGRRRFRRGRRPHRLQEDLLPTLIIMVDDGSLEDLVPMFQRHNIYVLRYAPLVAEAVFMAYQNLDIAFCPRVVLILINFRMGNGFDDVVRMLLYIRSLPRLTSFPVFVLLSDIDDSLFAPVEGTIWPSQVDALRSAGADVIFRVYPHELAVTTIIERLGL